MRLISGDHGVIEVLHSDLIRFVCLTTVLGMKWRIGRATYFSNSDEMMLAEAVEMERRKWFLKIKCLITWEIFNILVGY